MKREIARRVNLSQADGQSDWRSRTACLENDPRNPFETLVSRLVRGRPVWCSITVILRYACADVEEHPGLRRRRTERHGFGRPKSRLLTHSNSVNPAYDSIALRADRRLSQRQFVGHSHRRPVPNDRTQNLKLVQVHPFAPIIVSLKIS